MKLNKIIFAGLCFSFAVSAFTQEQRVQRRSDSASSKSETSVEDEYLNDVDGIVIMSLVESDEYDNKLVAMNFLEEAVKNGNASEDVMEALNHLAGEGIASQTRLNGRVMNNFPDIRRRACLALGKVKTEQAKNYLVKVTVADNEPMVVAAAVSSLGEIGLDNDAVVDAISFANRRNQILNPTSSLAYEVLEAYSKLAANTENKKIIINSISQIAADYHYVTPVRNKALKLLKTISDSRKSSDGK